MTTVLQLLLEGERLDTAQLASILNQSEAEVTAELERLQAEHILLVGVRSLILSVLKVNSCVQLLKCGSVRARYGFDRLAARISQFDAVSPAT